MSLEKNIYYPTNIPEILEIICNLVNEKTSTLWFRGQNKDYPLLLSLIRLAEPIYNSRGLPIGPFNSRSGAYAVAHSQLNMLNNFKLFAQDRFVRKPANDIEWLFLMQHYRLPTTLLDWTKDPMVAIFFTTNISESKIDELTELNDFAVIWCISPLSVNKFSFLVTDVTQNYIYGIILITD